MYHQPERISFSWLWSFLLVAFSFFSFAARALFVLPGIFGIDGMWTTSPAIDFIGDVNGIVILRYESKKWHE